MSRMREWMRDRRVAGALAGLALIVVLYRLVPVFRGAKAPMPDAPATTPAQGQRAAAEKVAPAKPASPGLPPAAGDIAWSWNRNPFLPAGKGADGGSRRGSGAVAGIARTGVGAAEETNGGGLPSTVTGTVISGKAGIAIFGNRLVPVGQRIGEWTVERVEPYRVSLRRGKELRVLEMYKPSGRGGAR